MVANTVFVSFSIHLSFNKFLRLSRTHIILLSEKNIVWLFDGEKNFKNYVPATQNKIGSNLKISKRVSSHGLFNIHFLYNVQHLSLSILVRTSV